mgnify:FL=1
MTSNGTLAFKRTVRGTPEEAYRAFVHPTALRDWMSDAAQVEARPGGRLYVWWNDGYSACGTFSTVEPGKRLVFSWLGFNEPGPTQVDIGFAPVKAGTRVTVKHSGFGEGHAWDDSRMGLTQGWESGLENLDSLLADGIDLRLARRPRLGIYIGELTAEIAKKIGAPAQGIRLDGTAEGSGAAAAGLQKDDVLVAFNGKPVTHFNDLGPLLAGLKGGDTVPVAFVRAGERRTVELTLGRFPIPKYPVTGVALARQARVSHMRINAELAKLTRGLTDTAAGHAPKKGEWSVKQLVAHLVLTERDLQSWAAQMINDREVGEDLEFRPNATVRVDALVARLKTLPALRRELALAQEETARLAEQLPRAFVTKRKHLYRRLAGWIVEITPGHFDQEHREQFARAIKAAAR